MQRSLGHGGQGVEWGFSPWGELGGTCWSSPHLLSMLLWATFCLKVDGNVPAPKETRADRKYSGLKCVMSQVIRASGSCLIIVGRHYADRDLSVISSDGKGGEQGLNGNGRELKALCCTLSRLEDDSCLLQAPQRCTLSVAWECGDMYSNFGRVETATF